MLSSTDQTEEMPLHQKEEEDSSSITVGKRKKREIMEIFHEQTGHFKTIIIIVLAAIMLFIILVLLRAFFHSFISNSHHLSRSMLELKQSLPKIIWIYTENQVEAQPMLSQVCINFHNHTLPNYNYQVRFVNSWNAYDWLSPIITQKITKAMHNSQIDSSVHSFLKYALLLEHGGILMSTFDYFLITDLTWVQDLFIENENYSEKYLCDPYQAEIFIQKSNYKNFFNSQYQEGFVAALPYSSIIRQSFDICENIFLFGTVPQNQDKHFIQNDRDTKALIIANPFETCLNIAMNRRQKDNQENKTCLGIQEIKYSFKYMIQEDSSKPLKAFLQPQWVQILQQRHTKMITAKSLWPSFLSYLNQIISGKKTIPNSTLINKILNVPGSRQIFIEELPKRQIQFCIISLQEMTLQEMKNMQRMIRKQTYENWMFVVSVQNPQQWDKPVDQKVKIIKTKSTTVHTIEYVCMYVSVATQAKTAAEAGFQFVLRAASLAAWMTNLME